MNGQHVSRTAAVRALCISFSGLLVLTVSLWNCSSAFATPIATSAGDVVVTIDAFNPVTQVSSSADFLIPVNEDDTFSLIGARDPGSNDWSLTNLDVTGNIDPFAFVSYSITNQNPSSVMIFSVSVTLPIAPLVPTTVHGGFMSALLTDSNLNGFARVTTVGGIPLYQGQIDSTTVLSFYPHPYVLTTPGGSAVVPFVTAGLPGPTLPSGPALSTIGILHVFSLTPGDTFSGTSFFQVEVVPEPSSLALVLGLCAMGLGSRRGTSRR